jgi:hypothetical protein
MKFAPALALAVILASATGCKQYEEVYSVSFRTNNGAELAGGDITLSSPLPAAGMIHGWYTLQLKSVASSSKEVEIFYQLFHHKESGRVEWTVSAPRMGVARSSFDFMPGFVDANIIARASPVLKGYWKGRWSYSVFSGSREGGGIEIRRR